ncbi:MAG: HAD family hydrolase [Candidatus Uhrbacteria bacterium]
MRQFDFVIFDFNGTLQNDRHVVYDLCVVRPFELLGLPAPTLETYLNEITHEFMPFYWRHGVPRDVSQKQWDTIICKCMEGEEPAGLFDDAREAVQIVVENIGHPALISGWPGPGLSEALVYHGLVGYFSMVLGGVTDKAREFRVCAEQAQIPPERIIVVGDMVDDAAAAVAVGMQVCIIPRGLHSEQRILAQHANIPTMRVLPDLASFAQLC